jgi:predicted secreted protein
VLEGVFDMKSKLVLAGLIIILSISLAACSSPDVEISVNSAELLIYKEINQEVEAETGDTIRVMLGSNPSTGFQWEEPVISDVIVIRQKGESEYIPAKEQIPGVGGNEAWSFNALKAGTSIITMKYSQPWDGGEKGVWRYTLTVTVK